MAYSWLSPAKQTEHQPAIRIDYNVNDNHRVTGTYNKLWQDRNPDQLNEFDHQFPDSPNFRHTVVRRPTSSIALRSTLSSALVNELRFGITRGERLFFGQPYSNGPQTFDDTNGYAIDFDGNIGLTNWHDGNAMAGRSAYQYTFDDTLSWQRGKHSLTFGGAAFLGRAWDDSQQMVPGINLGFNTANDPAAGMFGAANFPGASGGQLTDARDLYALLTGRVASVTGQAALDAETNQYSFLGKRRRAGKMDIYSAFIQDSWRMTPALTVNAGLRWDVQTAVFTGQRHHVVGEPRRCLRHLGSRRRRHLHRLQLLRSRVERRQGAGVSTVHHGYARLQHRLEQPRAERRRGLAATGRKRLAPRPSRRSRPGHSPRRLLRLLRPSGHGHLHRRIWSEPRKHPQPDARRQYGLGRARRNVARSPAARRAGCTRRPSRVADVSRSRSDRTVPTPSKRFTPTSRSRPPGPGPSAFSAR